MIGESKKIDSKYKVKKEWYQTHEDNQLAHLSPVLQKILRTRGINTKESADNFLNPDYDRDTHNPFLLKDMDKAVNRVIGAIRNKENIVIYSDYDTDGIPGSVALSDFFKKINYDKASVYIPHRHDEGFGFHSHTILPFKEKNVSLIITIDCGIVDNEAVKVANEHSIDVIITDHHLPGIDVPKAYAIINPKQADCKYPEKMLCGSGVIYKFIQAMMIALRREKMIGDDIKDGWEKWLLDMIGLATLSDMVPLIGENRVFAKYGLFVMKKTSRIGFTELLSLGRINQENIAEDDIGFTISPRINASSRMGVPYDAFRLLSTIDRDEAKQLSRHLENTNNERKGIVASMVKEVKKHFSDLKMNGQDVPKVIVVGNPSWKPALLGLVANNIADEWQRPVFVWGRDGDGVIKGSCRSGETYDLVKLMKKAESDTFIQFGGHAFSGGFSVANDKIFDLEKNLVDSLNQIIIEDNTVNNSDIKQCFDTAETIADGEIDIDEISLDLYKEIEKCAPFGVGNPKPVFIIKNVSPIEVSMFGKEKNHLKIVYEALNAPKGILSAIAFFKKEDDFQVKPKIDEYHNLVAHIEKSTWLGRTELRFRVVDIF